jgi:hypothetical protein
LNSDTLKIASAHTGKADIMFDDCGDPIIYGDISGELQSEYKLYDKLFSFPQNPAFSRSMMAKDIPQLLSLDAFCR